MLVYMDNPTWLGGDDIGRRRECCSRRGHSCRRARPAGERRAVTVLQHLCQQARGVDRGRRRRHRRLRRRFNGCAVQADDRRRRRWPLQ